MAGSKKWFIYTTDEGEDYALERDESNTEAVNAGTQDYPAGGTVLDSLPGNVRPRVAVFRSLDRTVQREIVCLTQTIFAALVAGSSFTDPVSGKVVYLSLKRGQWRRIPIGQDTGLDDGDDS